MSFEPLSESEIATSLLGVGDPARSIPTGGDAQDGELFEEIHSEFKKTTKTEYGRTIVLIIISAIIFVTIVAAYDVIRNAVNHHYTRRTSEDPLVQGTEEDMVAAVTTSRNRLIASIVFALIVVVTAVFLVPILVSISKSFSQEG